MKKFFNYLTICLMKMGTNVDVKNDDKDEKIGRMNLRMNFELSRSKLGYRATLMKILDKKFLTPFLRHF